MTISVRSLTLWTDKFAAVYTPVAAMIADLKANPSWGGEDSDSRHNLAVYAVQGSLVPQDSRERHYSVALSAEVVNAYKLELICEDSEVDALVAVVVAAGRTGQEIGGWVTVSDLVGAVPIH